MFAAQTYTARRDQLRAELRKNGQKGLVVLVGNAEAPRNCAGNTYAMRQDSTFLYFFGLDRHDLGALVDLDANTDTLYGDDYTVDDIIWMGAQPSLVEQATRCGVGHTAALEAMGAAIGQAKKQGRPIHILPPYRNHNKLLLGQWLGDYAKYVSEPLIEAVVALREVKSPEEVAEIEKACHIGYLMHTTAMKMARPGVTEREIAGEIEGIALKLGAGVSFHSIVSQRGETLHNHDHSGVLEQGRLLLVDAGAENVMNYCSDFTRTMPVGGKFTQQQKDIYRIVEAANREAKRITRPGITNQSVNLEVMFLMAEGLKELGLLKGDTHDAVLAGAPALLMPHGLGHQMGLDVHDMEDLGERLVGYNRLVERSTIPGLASLRMGKELLPGHVLTVEPGIYFIPALVEKWAAEGRCAEFVDFDKVRSYYGFGGIRLEDDILITADGNRQLGADRVPITVEEVEAFMQA